jgi:hypothetical protein
MFIPWHPRFKVAGHVRLSLSCVFGIDKLFYHNYQKRQGKIIWWEKLFFSGRFEGDWGRATLSYDIGLCRSSMPSSTNFFWVTTQSSPAAGKNQGLRTKKKAVKFCNRWKGTAYSHSSETACCVPGTARILKGALSLPFVLKLIKSLIQPDGGGPEQSIGASRKARATKGSGNDVAVWQPGVRWSAWADSEMSPSKMA